MTNTLDDGSVGSLRWAITEANNNAGADVIEFDIGAGGHQVITLSGTLPSVTETTVLDAQTQDGFVGTPLIEIDGNQIADVGFDFTSTAINCVARGFIINNMPPSHGAFSIGAAGVTVQGNYIGTDHTGMLARPNGVGIWVGAPDVLIGGENPGEGNVISGSAEWGIYAATAVGVRIQGNKIGTNAAGTAAIPNDRGIWSDSAASGTLQIGGLTSTPGTGAGNLISGNRVGYDVEAPSSLVQGNLIGTDITGTAAIPNREGIRSFPYYGQVTIGGTAEGARNVISGNFIPAESTGVGITGGGFVVQGNYIGTDITGSVALPNGKGVAGGGTIGGVVAAARNVIGGNFNSEIFDQGSLIQGNFIGTDATGEVGLSPSAYAGVDCRYTSGSTIEGNVISLGGSGWGNWGIVMAGVNTRIAGNYIGTNKDGTHAIGNGAGIFLAQGSSNNTIGGTTAADRNVISGNTYGIIALAPNEGGIVDVNTTVRGNYFGTDPTATLPVGNGFAIYVLNGVTGLSIGGVNAGEGNLFAHNVVGVRLDAYVEEYDADDPRGIATLGNRFANNGYAIDLIQGYANDDTLITLNDAGLGDADTGPNGLQNYPVLTTAGYGAVSEVTGTLDTAPNHSYRIEFFASATEYSTYAQPRGQGERYLGYIEVASGPTGVVAFTASNLAATTANEYITATATPLDGPDAGGTSEFSDWIVADTENVLNTAAASDIDGQSNGVPGQPRTYQISAVDIDSGDDAAGFTYVVDFGDGSPLETIPATANNGSGLTLNHVFKVTGIYTISVTATDQHGATSDPVTLGVTIESAQIQDDPLHPGQNLLAVGGTLEDDIIKIKPGNDCGEVKVVMRDDERELFYRHTFDPVIHRVAVYGQSGNDRIKVLEEITIPAWLYGGAGDDSLRGGSGDDVILGGDGADLLAGNCGRDLLIGGAGADKVVGDANDDILISGQTAFDAVDAALAVIVAEWTSNRCYAERVANIQGAGTGPRDNENIFLTVDGPNATVVDDGTKDTLTGGSGLDWFLFNADGDNDAARDKVTDLCDPEFAIDLEFILSP